jgi:Cu(I)/Ag(I) efflux system protein CusF
VNKLISTAAAALLALTLNGAAAMAQDSTVIGEVRKIDESAGKITLKHGPIKNLGMDEGMTMVFRAGDPAMIKAVKPGDRIRFVPDRINGQFTVTKIEKAK